MFSKTFADGGIIIGSKVQFGKNAYLHGRNIEIGKNTVVTGLRAVYDNVRIGENCILGNDVADIGPNVYIRDNVIIDPNLTEFVKKQDANKIFPLSIEHSQIKNTEIRTWHIGRDYIDKDLVDVHIGNFVDLSDIGPVAFAEFVYSANIIVTDYSVLNRNEVRTLIQKRAEMLAARLQSRSDSTRYEPLRIIINGNKKTIEDFFYHNNKVLFELP